MGEPKGYLEAWVAWAWLRESHRLPWVPLRSTRLVEYNCCLKPHRREAEGRAYIQETKPL